MKRLIFILEIGFVSIAPLAQAAAQNLGQTIITCSPKTILFTKYFVIQKFRRSFNVTESMNNFVYRILQIKVVENGGTVEGVSVDYPESKVNFERSTGDFATDDGFVKLTVKGQASTVDIRFPAGQKGEELNATSHGDWVCAFIR